MATSLDIPFGQWLVAAGVLSEPDLARAEERQRASGERLADAIVRLGYCTPEEIARALARRLGLSYVSREEFPTSPPFLRNLSPQYMRQYRFCPLAVENGTLLIACADPTDPIASDELRAALGLDVRQAVATEPAILEAIERYFGTGSTAVQKVIETIRDDEWAGDESGSEDVNSLRDMAFDAPVVRLVNLLIENAVTSNASDIHIEPFEDNLRVRYRIDGVLFDAETPPKRLRAAITSRIKIMAELNIAERRLPQDGRIRMSLQGRRLDIRVSTIPTIHGESVVMRLLDRAAILMPLDRLGFDPRTERQIQHIINLPHGMLLVTGPTGSGKTTTLYAALDKINSPGKKIITIEDPVEYQLRGVNQIHVKPKIGLTFSSGLRHIVRQDPDVIMVGEIRDVETADIAIHAALTGHLVFSTLHTNDAPGAITRLLDMGAEPYLVASVLEGILAQRLVRIICASCRVPYEPEPKELRAMGIDEVPGDAALQRGKGCGECRGTGYRGRTGIYEFLPMTEDFRSMTLRKVPGHEIRQRAIAAGMTTLRQDGWAKCCLGVTTIEEVLRVTHEDSEE
ncbi:MAG TPA: type II secretion system ATPase GspE [Methylomirabilota bacterium]|jgi:general secretion pathway protein E|nr:type II secretion system ATPase GspE [Methylomirabilota bacterium]